MATAATSPPNRHAIWSPPPPGPERAKSVDPLYYGRVPGPPPAQRPILPPAVSFSASLAAREAAAKEASAKEAASKEPSKETTVPPTPHQSQRPQLTQHARWVPPRSVTPGPGVTTAKPHGHVRARSGTGSFDAPVRSGTPGSTSSGGSTSTQSRVQPQPPLPPLPQSVRQQQLQHQPQQSQRPNSQQHGTQQHRRTSSAADGQEENWKSQIHTEMMMLFRKRVGKLDADLQNALRPGGLHGRKVDKATEKWLIASHQKQVQDLDATMQEQLRERIRREGIERLRQSSQIMTTNGASTNGATTNGLRSRVVIEDDDDESSESEEDEDEEEESLWPNMDDDDSRLRSLRDPRLRGAVERRWRKAVQEEQQVIWDASQRHTNGGPPPAQSPPMASNSSYSDIHANGRKVHWASIPSSGTNGNMQAPGMGRTTSPVIPRTPRTPYNGFGGVYPGPGGHPARPMSAAPPLLRNGSPAFSAVGMARPGSARPESPAVRYGEKEVWRENGDKGKDKEPTFHERWIPSVAEYQADLRAQERERSASAAGSRPVPIPGRNNGRSGADGSDSTPTAGSNSTTGSWRDWVKVPFMGVGPNSVSSGGDRRAMTPAPASSKFSFGGGVSQAGPAVQNRPRRMSFTHSSGSAGGANHSHSHSHTITMANGPPVQNVQNLQNLQSRMRNQGPIRRNGTPIGTSVVDDRDAEVPPLILKHIQHELQQQQAAQHLAHLKRISARTNAIARADSGGRAIPDDDAPSEEYIAARRKEKGKGRALPPPVQPETSLWAGYGGMGAHGVEPLLTAQLEDYAVMLKRELSISTEA